ncbi:MAG: hypothetical protein KAJ19_26155 [Gammaproteobacteria bacterium]|nr:hypothetical protein [Gammaproteobacteria bacterium]
MKWLVFTDNMCGCGGFHGHPDTFETETEAKAYIKEQIETYPSVRDDEDYLLVHGEIVKED